MAGGVGDVGQFAGGSAERAAAEVMAVISAKAGIQ